ncbi:MAG: Bax inhibitor-1/YccA family protein [Bacteroidaceae bacterium]|jgi:FtsH-binding integral membrane protein|nr:Bax inhibitor-1/YccA family protein [Bacteroidaceae bacterium]
MYNKTYNNYSTSVDKSAAFPALMRNVYIWMTMALAVTGLTAAYVSSSPAILQYIFTGKTIWLLALGELGLVWYLSARIMKISFSTAGILFVLFSILNGVTLSSIFLVYTMESIALTFYITAGTFGAMSLVGYFTKKDLSTMGRFLVMALIGLIIASIVNLFMQSTMLMWITTYAGVLIFCGLTAYDTQKIKDMLIFYGNETHEGTLKIALMGSLTLYLDFINLFIYLLRIFGSRRD